MIARGHQFFPRAQRWGNVPALILAVVLCGTGSIAEQQAHSSEQQTEERKTEEIVYIPPVAGAPADRLATETRDAASTAWGPVTLLVPDAGGVSASPKPMLVWHFAIPLEGRVSIALRPMEGLARGFATTVDGKFRNGFHLLDLRRSEVELVPGRLYQWEVVVATPTSEEPIRKSAFVEHRPQQAQPASVRDAAAQGLWFDALAFVFEVDASGRISLRDPLRFEMLSASGGLDLTNIVEAPE